MEDNKQVDANLQSDTAQVPRAPKRSFKAPTFFTRWTSQTRAYLAEYAVQLILMSALIGLVVSLFNGIIDSFGEQSSSWLSSFQYNISIGQLAAVVAILPLLMVITRRTAATEAMHPLVKESNWRKGFLGVFLVGLGLTAVCYVIGFVFVVFSLLSNIGLSVDTDGGNPALTLLKAAFGAALFGLSALLYARDYRSESSSAVKNWQRIHRYGLVGLAVVILVVFTALPLQKQRGAYVDKLVVSDLREIVRGVSSYASDERELPKELDDIDVSDDVQARIESLNYEYKPASSGGSYEICATFKTDASKGSGSDNPISSIANGVSSSSSSSSSTSNQIAKHKKGYQCFRQTASGVRSSSSLQRSRGLDSILNRSYDYSEDLEGSRL